MAAFYAALIIATIVGVVGLHVVIKRQEVDHETGPARAVSQAV